MSLFCRQPVCLEGNTAPAPQQSPEGSPDAQWVGQAESGEAEDLNVSQATRQIPQKME